MILLMLINIPSVVILILLKYSIFDCINANKYSFCYRINAYKYSIRIRILGVIYLPLYICWRECIQCGRKKKKKRPRQQRPRDRSNISLTAKTSLRHFSHQLYGCLHGRIFLKFRMRTDIINANEQPFGAGRNSFAVFTRRIRLFFLS